MKNRFSQFVVILVVAMAATATRSQAQGIADFTMPTLPPEIVPGEYQLTVSWDAGTMSRSILLIIPDDYDSKVKHPLVHVLHGSHQSANGFRQGRQGLVTRANNEGVILVFPQGRPNRAGEGFLWDSGAEDNQYITQLTAWLVDELAVDASRVVLTGFSGGSGLTQRLIALRPQWFAGAVAVCGSSGSFVIDPVSNEKVHTQGPVPVEPVPIILIRGGQDELVTPDGSPNRNGLRYDTVGDQFSFWLEGYGCDADEAESTSPVPGVTLRRAGGCDPGGAVYSLFDENLGHRWSGAQDTINVDALVIEFVAALRERARAHILEIERQPDGWCRIAFLGRSGSNYTLDGSAALTEWETERVWLAMGAKTSVLEFASKGSRQTIYAKSNDPARYFRINSQGESDEPTALDAAVLGSIRRE